MYKTYKEVLGEINKGEGMTKELELFKRWFGFDPLDIIRRGDEDQNVIIEMLRIYDEPTCQLVFASKESIMFGINDTQYINYISSGYCEGHGYIDTPFSLNITFNIPPQYYTEWEQYVKEKADE